MTTTSEDVWRILAELATAQAELTAAQKETDKQLKETDLLLKEVSQQQKENAQQIKETDRQQQKTDKQLKELGQQIGGLGAKFGSFTEGLALPSMETILRQRFGMKVVSPSVRASEDGQNLEIDVLAYTNGELNTAYIVEVKSHAREESITQLKSILQRFRSFFPEHKDKIVIEQIRGKKSSMATTSEDVWRILAELTAAQKETDKQLKEISQQGNK